MLIDSRLALRALATLAVLSCVLGESHAAPPVIVGAELGVGGQYKLGCWAPLKVRVAGGDEPMAVHVVALAPDNDGLGVATLAPGGLPLSTEPGRESVETLYVRVGKSDAPIRVRLMQGRRSLDEKVLRVYDEDDPIPQPVQATDHLLLEIGGEYGIEKVLNDATSDRNWSSDACGLVLAPADLPRDWVGYEGCDTVLLGVRGDWWRGLTGNDPRIVALRQWVESGGRLVVSCGEFGAEALAPDGPFATLVPGVFSGLQALSRTGAIERYAESSEDIDPIDLEGGTIPCTRLRDVRGLVEAREGSGDESLPLVVRAPLGFGEVVFFGADLWRPAIASWPGRNDLLRKLLGDAYSPLASQAESGALRNSNTSLVSMVVDRLNNTFTDVSTVPFLAVVGLVLLYLALVGPGDYFFVKKVLGRAEATWITFPLIVIVTSVAAYAAAYWIKGEGLRINQVEWVDVDTSDGLARGTVVTQVFSPRAERYNLALKARGLDGAPLRGDTEYVAWLGEPGAGLGGMQSVAVGAPNWRRDYVIDATPLLSSVEGADRPMVDGLPILVWSVKSLVSRWSGRMTASLDADLESRRDGLVEGAITNVTGADLKDCRLIYGDWAWRLGGLRDGETVTIDGSIDQISVNTMLRSALLEGAGVPASRHESVSVGDLAHRELTVQSLAPLFAVRGSLSGADEHFHPAHLRFMQLSHQLEAGRAILLAQVSGGPRSELLRDGESLVGEDDKYDVFCRFLLDVQGAE